MGGTPASADDRVRYTELVDALWSRIYAYARRHCETTEAQDVVADTFLVAWRRVGEIPEDALPWLLVVARNTIANQHRHRLRQDRLADSVGRLASLAGPADGADQTVLERDALLRGLADLSAKEREAVLLVAWDGLSGRDAAAVAGCSHRAFEVRLSRGRAKLSHAARPDDPADRAAVDHNQGSR